LTKAVFITGFLLVLTVNKANSHPSIYCGISGSVLYNQYSFAHIPVRELDSPIQPGFGIQFGTLVKDKIHLRTGLQRTYYELSIVYDWYIPGQPVISDPSIPDRSYYEYSYLQFPLSIGYKINLVERFDIVPQIGASYLLLTNQSEYSKSSDETRGSDVLNLNSINSNHFQATVMVSFIVRLNENWFINIEPYIGRSLIKQYPHFFDSKYLTFGGLVGIYRKLN
jgi:hypothetical protein